MNATLRRLVALLVLVLAPSSCSDSGVGVETRTSLALTVNAAQVSATSGRIQIEGPENRTVSISPGDREQIDLEPGSYTVALEGLSGGTVVGYWERRATVTEGQQTELTVNLTPFQGSAPPSAAAQAVSGEPFIVSWSPVGGADSYDLQASTSPSFSNVGDELRVENGTSAEVTVTGNATVYFRVRARTRFNGVGNFGPSSSGTAIRIPVTSVAVTPQDAELEVGETLTYQATTRGPGGQELTGRTVTWSSTNPGVATVDASTGQVTAVAGGTTTIEATSEGVTGTSVLTVVEVPAAVTIEPQAVTIPLGGTAQLTATVRSASGDALSGFDVTWRSDAPSVVSVNSSGVVTGVLGGSTIVRATVVGFPEIEGEAVVTVGAGSPPRIEAFQVDFLGFVDTCRQIEGDFRIIERLVYADDDGDMDPSRSFEDPAGSAQADNIEVQFRAQDIADWSDFSLRKRFTPNTGASGSSGQLDGNDPTCFGGGDENLQYLDFRVRVQDASGNWSDWFETRKFMPAEITVTPAGRVDLTPGAAPIAYEATQILDHAGNPLPLNLVSWSNYAWPGLASINSQGSYRPNGTENGADWVMARAAYAQTLRRVVIGFADQMWFSPGYQWNIAYSINFRTPVYAGREYTFRITPDGATSGDVDLFIKFGEPASQTNFDDFSVGPANDEEIVYTAPEDGVVWVRIQVLSTPSPVNPLFSIDGDSSPPRRNEAIPAATPGRPGVTFGTTGVEDLGIGPRPASADGRRSSRPAEARLLGPGG